jgi:hypothetical protein
MPWAREQTAPYGPYDDVYHVSGTKEIGIYDIRRVSRTSEEIQEAAGNAQRILTDQHERQHAAAQRPDHTGIVVRYSDFDR